MKKIYTIVFFISVGLAFSAIVAAGIYGLKFGVDFKGGSVMELNFKNGRPQISEIQSLLSGEAEFKEAGVNLAGQSGIIIKSGELSEQTHQNILKKISRRKNLLKLKRDFEQKFGKIKNILVRSNQDSSKPEKERRLRKKK